MFKYKNNVHAYCTYAAMFMIRFNCNRVPDEEIESRLREMSRDGGWEGNDIKQSQEMELRREMYEESGSHGIGGMGTMGTDGSRYATAQRMEHSGGEGELVAEYEITRHVTMDTTRMALPETEYIYERDIRG